MPIRRRCLIIIQKLLIPTALHFLPASSAPTSSSGSLFFPSLERKERREALGRRLPADERLEFHGAQSSPFPLPLGRSLLNVCALVLIFYCFLCTSQNSLSWADHNCVPVKVSSHWLLRFRALVVNYST